ncbi:hypothetical protein GCM10029992_03360 [Glycomyces albus]
MAVVVVAGAVVGLAYYLRLARTVLLGEGAIARPGSPSPSWPPESSSPR